MTNVQTPTGLASPVAQRVTLPRRHSSVCRNLFGPIDHDELNRELKATLKEISEQDQRRWNFHFETDTPIPGSYEWEGISAESMPAFYQESEVGGRRFFPKEEKINVRDEEHPAQFFPLNSP
ncbi:cyclin-dependent kinase inhibitor 1C-like isoform X2 [Salmo trutta]|uniref:cyclin-dependent kinase inhibitor 1C-like isoform X2 n=1 Tax=Salmo trutta TaxID=8032 RepID=UPI001130D304|nr:cyclin-dependent kinase inhibitor 1C-like isoform X2 [Salmo trutta]